MKTLRIGKLILLLQLLSISVVNGQSKSNGLETMLDYFKSSSLPFYSDSINSVEIDSNELFIQINAIAYTSFAGREHTVASINIDKSTGKKMLLESYLNSKIDCKYTLAYDEQGCIINMLFINNGKAIYYNEVTYPDSTTEIFTKVILGEEKYVANSNTYFPNGMIKSTLVSIEGDLYKKTEYYQNGMPLSTSLVVDGTIYTGPYIEFYNTGKIKAKGSYLNQELVLATESTRRRSIKVGEWCYYDENGDERVVFESKPDDLGGGG